MKEFQETSRCILEGIQVLDLSTLITGPYCASLLGDLGAEVIKVEHPRGGDGIRRVGTTFLEGESALFHRQKTGEGQRICVNLLDAAMCLQTTLFTEYFISGRRPTPTGNASPFAYPVDIFRSADGYVSIGAFNDKFWRNLCKALNLETLADDPWFSTQEKRLANREDLGSLLSKVLISRKTREWLEILEKADVPCGPVHDYDTIFSDPQVLHNQLAKRLPHSRLKEVRTLGNPITFSQTPAREGRGAPLLGEDTESVLQLLGYKPEEVKEFRKKKVI